MINKPRNVSLVIRVGFHCRQGWFPFHWCWEPILKHWDYHFLCSQSEFLIEHRIQGLFVYCCLVLLPCTCRKQPLWKQKKFHKWVAQPCREKEMHKVYSFHACSSLPGMRLWWLCETIDSKQSSSPSDNSPTIEVCNTLKMNESGLITWNTVLSPHSPASQPSCTSQTPLPSKRVRVQDYIPSCIIIIGSGGWGGGERKLWYLLNAWPSYHSCPVLVAADPVWRRPPPLPSPWGIQPWGGGCPASCYPSSLLLLAALQILR